MKGIKSALTGFLLVCTFAFAPAVAARPATGADSGKIALSALPAQAVETWHLIHRGGPFKSEKDGVVFGNRERLLPAHKRGYYREYTVVMRLGRGRGLRRIVCGGATRTPDACYYSDDHYASFRRIVD